MSINTRCECGNSTFCIDNMGKVTFICCTKCHSPRLVLASWEFPLTGETIMTRPEDIPKIVNLLKGVSHG